MSLTVDGDLIVLLTVVLLGPFLGIAGYLIFTLVAEIVAAPLIEFFRNLSL